MALVFIVEDDNDIRQIEAYALKCGGFEIEEFEDAKALYERLEKKTPDLFLLDVMLPDEDGLEIVKKLRAMPQTKHLPVMMVTAKTTELDKVRGLDIGADDYITQPFSPNELVARVKAHLNRYIRLTRKRSDENEYIEYPGLKIDRTARRVFVDGEERCFTTKEFDLLTYLATHPNHVFSKDELFSAVWGMDSMGEIATVTVHIKKIRKKTENSNVKAGYIETVWGAGYRFRVLNGKVDEEKESVINAI